MTTTKVNPTSTVAEIPTQAAIAAKQLEVNHLRVQLMSNLASGQREYFQYPSQFLGKEENLFHLCSTNNISVHINAKKYSFNIEAAYGCKSRDLSIHIDVVGSDCLFFIHFNFFVMPTTNVDSASTVAEIPTQAAIAAKQLEVNHLRDQLMSNLVSGQREYFRNLWGKAREELSRMQTLHYFGQKKVYHG